MNSAYYIKRKGRNPVRESAFSHLVNALDGNQGNKIIPHLLPTSPFSRSQRRINVVRVSFDGGPASECDRRAGVMSQMAYGCSTTTFKANSYGRCFHELDRITGCIRGISARDAGYGGDGHSNPEVLAACSSVHLDSNRFDMPANTACELKAEQGSRLYERLDSQNYGGVSPVLWTNDSNSQQGAGTLATTFWQKPGIGVAAISPVERRDTTILDPIEQHLERPQAVGCPQT